MGCLGSRGAASALPTAPLSSYPQHAALAQLWSMLPILFSYGELIRPPIVCRAYADAMHGTHSMMQSHALIAYHILAVRVYGCSDQCTEQLW
jgi:hypothetical protein